MPLTCLLVAVSSKYCHGVTCICISHQFGDGRCGGEGLVHLWCQPPSPFRKDTLMTPVERFPETVQDLLHHLYGIEESIKLRWNLVASCPFSMSGFIMQQIGALVPVSTVKARTLTIITLTLDPTTLFLTRGLLSQTYSAYPEAEKSETDHIVLALKYNSYPGPLVSE